MALIICPECNKEISDQNKQCIHCGYNLINTKCIINSIEYDFSEELNIALLPNDNYYPAIGAIRRKTSLSLSDGTTLVNIIRELKEIPKTFEPKYALENREKYNKSIQTPKPKCPTCSSTNVSKISVTSKAVSVGLWGIFSQKVKKQFKCGNCGYEW